MADIVDTTDVEIKATGALKIKESILYRLLLANASAMQTLIWGTRFYLAVAHNHGNQGGSLLGRPLLWWSLGPHFREGTANPPVIGIPLAPPQAGVSLAATPKLLASCAMLLPGGVVSLHGRVGVRLPGAGFRSVTLIVGLRLLRNAGFDHDGGAGTVTQSVTIATSAAGSYFDAACSIALPASLGGPHQDRLIEVCLWQASDPPAATTYRALFLAFWPGSEAPGVVSGGLIGQPLAQVDPTEIVSPGYLVAKWIDRARYTFDHLLSGAIGSVPGKSNLSAASPDAPDREQVWFKGIECQHQHTGKSEGDGAILRYPLYGQCYAVDFGDDGAGEVSAEGYRGQKIDPSGGGTPTFNLLTRFTARVSLGKGCKGLDVTFALLPGHLSITGRLFVYARAIRALDATIDTVSNPDIITNVLASGGSSVGLPTRILSFRGVEVRPIDSAGYQTNASRAGDGYHGHWTAAAELPDTQMPLGLLANNLYRISDGLRLDIAPTITGDYDVEFRLALQDAAGDWVSAARLQWLFIVPATGY